MNRASIYWWAQDSISDDYCFNVQIMTWIGGGYYYAGNGKFCKTKEEAISFCEKNNVPERLRDWCVDCKDSRGEVWHVWCDECLAEEIYNGKTNWGNFRNNDFYWSENSVRYAVDIEGRIVILCEC